MTTSADVRQGPVLEATGTRIFLQFLRPIEMQQGCQLPSVTSVIRVRQFVQDLLQLRVQSRDTEQRTATNQYSHVTLNQQTATNYTLQWRAAC
jgi:hypothetical protein